MRPLIILIFAALFVKGCKHTKQVAYETNSIESNSESLIDKELGWRKLPNKTGDYVLYIEIVEENIKVTQLKRTFYIKNAKGEKIFEDSIYGGYVKWNDDSKIEYFNTPGVIPPNYDKDDFITIFDVNKGISYPKSSEDN